MIPFKPKINVLPGDHVVPGGTFPMPPALAHLCSIIPPANKFIGPFVHVEYLIEVFNKIQLPDKGEIYDVFFNLIVFMLFIYFFRH